MPPLLGDDHRGRLLESGAVMSRQLTRSAGAGPLLVADNLVKHYKSRDGQGDRARR